MTFWTLNKFQWLPNRSDFSTKLLPWYRAWPSPNYMRIWPMLLIKSDLKLCIHLSRSLFLYYKWFPWSISNGYDMPAGNAYPSGHLVPSSFLGLAYAPIVEASFLKLNASFSTFALNITGFFLDFAYYLWCLCTYVDDLSAYGSWW